VIVRAYVGTCTCIRVCSVWSLHVLNAPFLQNNGLYTIQKVLLPNNVV